MGQSKGLPHLITSHTGLFSSLILKVMIIDHSYVGMTPRACLVGQSKGLPHLITSHTGLFSSLILKVIINLMIIDHSDVGMITNYNMTHKTSKRTSIKQT